MTHLLIATRNPHKVEEIRNVFGKAFECQSVSDVSGVPEVVEDADTFEGNARKKAETLADWLRKTQNAERGAVSEISFVLADDSGLEVDALGGAPGVHSARFAALDTGTAGNSTDAENNAKLLQLLADIPLEQRTARFRCALALMPLDPCSALHCPKSFEGACEGRIDFEAHGNQGFGYDPLFVPDGFQQTFAELGEETKNRISHRSKALARLRQWFKAQAVDQ